MDKTIKSLFPELTEGEIMKGIRASVLHIRSKVPLRGEVAMRWKSNAQGLQKWICPCGAEYDCYTTFCRDGCRHKNITGGGG